jgi:hypothetical protein
MANLSSSLALWFRRVGFGGRTQLPEFCYNFSTPLRRNPSKLFNANCYFAIANESAQTHQKEQHANSSLKCNFYQSFLPSDWYRKASFQRAKEYF